MKELSLFSGAGGGLLGSLLLGWETIGYVEFNDYCQRVIRARIDDGILHDAPIFGDIRTFLSEGYAAAYTGLVDVVSGGFPCQPFSVAGKRAGADDPRNMWPSTLGVIRTVRPRYAFLENVPGLINSGYFDTILGDLAESGYDARWRVLSAAELGAPHKRDRFWIVADDMQQRKLDSFLWEANSDRIGQARSELASVADTEGDAITDASKPRLEKQQRQPGNNEQEQSAAKRTSYPRQWWATEPNVGRVAHGVASRVDRLKALGNGQVPAVAAAAWRLLTSEY